MVAPLVVILEVVMAERVGGVVSEVVMVKVAITEVLEEIVTLHDPVPEQAPDQPVKVEPEDGEAMRVIWVPEVIFDWVQTEPQDIEPPVTVPLPVPDLKTEREKVVG